MQPIDTFNQIIFHQVGWFAAFCGAAIMRPDWRPTGLVCFWVTLNTLFVVFATYTLCVCDWDMFWQLLTIYGLGLQGCTKYACVIYHSRAIGAKVQLLQHIYRCNGDPANATNYEIMVRWSRMCERVSRIGIIIIGTSILTLMPLTAASNWLRGRDELLLPLLVPGIAVRESRLAWWTTYVVHVFMCVLGAFGLCATDMLLIEFVVHMMPLSELIAAEFGQLNAAAQAIGGGGVRRGAEAQRERHALKMFFRNLLRMHQDFCEYVRVEETGSVLGSFG